MRRVRHCMTAAVLGGLTVLGAAFAPSLHAQGLEVTSFGTAEWDSDDVSIYLLGASVTPEGLGLKPTAGLQAYRVEYESADLFGNPDEVDVWTVAPNVGLKYRTGGGAYQARVGYAFRFGDDDEDEIAIGDAPFGASEDGIVTSAQADIWGTNPLDFQAIGSYNFGSEYLWSRGRSTARLMRFDNGGSLRLGGEVVWQGFVEDDTEDYSALQFGPVLSWHVRPETILTVGGGWKDVEDDDETHGYFKLEFVYGF